MKITVLGPSLPAAAAKSGMIHVHAAGCRDASNRRKYGNEVDYPCVIDAASRYDVLEFLWSDHAGDYGYKPGMPEYDEYLMENLPDTHFHACTSSLA
jgi:hypothetical protein